MCTKIAKSRFCLNINVALNIPYSSVGGHCKAIPWLSIVTMGQFIHLLTLKSVALICTTAPNYAVLLFMKRM